MSDLRLTWQTEAADIAIASNDLATDDGLETAVIVSLFSDRRLHDSDALPDAQTDRRGWWGDALADVDRDRIGSRLWLLAREKELAAVAERAQVYAAEALQWLLDDRVASAVSVAAEITRPGLLGLAITIARPSTTPAAFRFDYTWTAQGARLALAGPAPALIPVGEDGNVSLVVNQQLQNLATSGAGTAVDTLGVARDLSVYIIGGAGVTAGAVTLEEAHEQTFAGTWAPLGPPIDVAANAVKVVRVRGCFRALRAPITTPVVGGTVSVFVMGN